MTTYTLPGYWTIALKYCARYNFNALRYPFPLALDKLRKNLPQKIIQQLLQAKEEQVSLPFITLQDERYPKSLQHIPCAPPVLFYKGNIDCLISHQIAIVGTRKCSTMAKAITAEFASTLSNQATIVSGLAYGVDQIAHSHSLPNTIGVCGQGLGLPFQGYRNKITSEILNNGGLLLSEFHPQQPPKKWTYVQRNRTIAGLVNSLLVTEAPLRSGALISAINALNFGREVYVVPCHPYHKQGLGGLKLLCDGALFALHPSDILATAVQQQDIPLLQDLDRPRTTEELLQQSSKDVSELLQQLLQLQAQGFVYQNGPYWISTRKSKHPPRNI